MARLTTDTEADVLLSTIEPPPLIVRGLQALALLAGAAIVAGHLAVDEDGLRTFVVVTAMLVPWLLEAASLRPHPLLFTTMVLAPPALELVAVVALAGTDAWRDGDGFGFGSASTLYLGVVLLICTSFASRRDLALTVAATAVVYLARVAVDRDGFSGVSVTMALSLTTLACVGIRLGAMSIVRAQRAVVERDDADRRRQIARDVHDVVAHSLAVTMLHLTAARMALLRDDAVAAIEALDEAERHGQASMADLRRIVGLLESFPDARVAPRTDLRDIPALVDSYRKAGLTITLHVRGALDDGPDDTTGTTTYRVLREALANAARHGDGSAEVELALADGSVELSVRNPCRPSSASAGIGNGISGMRERVAAAGGTITVGAHDDGWHVAAVLGAGRPGTRERTEATAP